MIWTACRRRGAAISPAPATRPLMPRTGLSPTGRKNLFVPVPGSHFGDTQGIFIPDPIPIFLKCTLGGGINQNIRAVLLLWNRKDLLRFRFWLQLWKSSGSGCGSRQYSALFSKNKKLHKILPFQCQKELISRNLASHFFIFFIHFMLDPDPNPVPEPDP
jgi:hypothetical protein